MTPCPKCGTTENLADNSLLCQQCYRAAIARLPATCRLTDDWLPLPADVLADLGWEEGDKLELEIVQGVLVVTPINPAEPRVDADR